MHDKTRPKPPSRFSIEVIPTINEDSPPSPTLFNPMHFPMPENSASPIFPPIPPPLPPSPSPSFDSEYVEHTVSDANGPGEKFLPSMQYASVFLTYEPHDDNDPDTHYYIIDIDHRPCYTEDAQTFTMYKRVDKKVRPIPAVYPHEARTERHFPENPLDSLPPLSPNPPEFIPTQKVTQERMDEIDINQHGFLYPEEVKLFQNILRTNEHVLAFEDQERGTLKDSYFSPYIIPTVAHEPWSERNIPIPPGVLEDVLELLKSRIATGVYEPSQASYRSRWFCVVKKNGKLRIVHDLQKLNSVTIRDTGVPPVLDSFVEPFAGASCYTGFDLYSGYDARILHPDSRDLTSFMTPLGLLRIRSLPQGFTNSPAEFQNCMVFILQDEIPDKGNIFIDDLFVKGPKTRYELPDGSYEVIKENPGIRRFVWEHAQDVHRVMHRIGHAGATFAAKKSQICTPSANILGQMCTYEGRLPDGSKVSKIIKWPVPQTPKDVRAFLGLCGGLRIWIENYTKLVRPLTELYRIGFEFIWDQRRQDAFDKIKELVTTAPALRPIDYTSSNPVYLSVDTSIYAIGMILSQEDDTGRRRNARYGSLPIVGSQANYGQAKLELFGLHRALRHYRLYLYGVKNLHVEMDAQYIKGMLREPDLQPNATINRWIQGILLFTFTLHHIPADRFTAVDALSRRPPADDDSEYSDYDDEWLDEIALPIMTVPGSNPCSEWTSGTAPISVVLHIRSEDTELEHIKKLLTLETLPSHISAAHRRRLIQKSQRYIIRGHKLCRKSGSNLLQVIFEHTRRRNLLLQAHEDIGHRGQFGTFETLRKRFYWPGIHADIRAHLQSCHQCQIRSTKKVEIPLTVSTTATIFTKLYMDAMHMPAAGGFHYIIAIRDDLTLGAEGRAVRNVKADTIAKFLKEEIIYRYGAIGEIVTDNGPETKKATKKLMKQFGIAQIRVSAYNSKANGVVERGHFIIREAILKACKGDFKKWPDLVGPAFFADKITTRASTGFSPFYLIHGVEPVLPFDLTEATFLVEGFTKGMSSVNLLALRIRQLQKLPEDIASAVATLKRTRYKSKEVFEKRFGSRISTRIFKPGEIVLARNTRVEKELNRKHKSRYLGPYEVHRRTEGGSYMLKELNGTHVRRRFAAFRLVPYFSRGDLQDIEPEYEKDIPAPAEDSDSEDEWE